MNKVKPQEEPKVGDVPHRLLDGYDGGQQPPAEFIKELLDGAPEEVKARAKQWAEERGQTDAARRDLDAAE